MLQVRKNESWGAAEKKTRFRKTISKTDAEDNKRNHMAKTASKTAAEGNKRNYMPKTTSKTT